MRVDCVVDEGCETEVVGGDDGWETGVTVVVVEVGAVVEVVTTTGAGA